MIHQTGLGRRALAGLGLSLVCLNLVPATPAAAQAAPTPDQSYYWCQLLMPVHGNSVLYVSSILPNPKPIAKGVPQDEIGRAFVRYLVKKYSPDDPNQFGDSPHWGSVCKTTWPYGMSSAKGPRDKAIAAGAVAVDWTYSPDQDVPLPSASAPPTSSASEAAIAAHCQHIANDYALAKCRERWGGQPAPATATPAPTPQVTPTPAPAPASAPVSHPPAAQSHAVAATAAPPTPHPAPASTPRTPTPPQAVFVVCSADSNPHTRYINPPIDGGTGNNESWTKDYRAYLEPLYGYRGNIRCNRQPTRDAAEAFYEKKLEQLRTKPGNGGSPPTIVVTEWK